MKNGSSALILDGNAAAGIFQEIFGVEMTAGPAGCVHCGNRTMLGALQLYQHAPGAVLRCPSCEEVMLRIVTSAEAIYLDARGVSFLRVPRTR